MRTVWLASYPKSGNTWFRLLIANLTAGTEPVDINRIVPSRIASSRFMFDHYLLFDSSLLTHDELDLLRPGVHAAFAADAQPDDTSDAEDAPIAFLKTHDAYTVNAAGEAMLGGRRGADGAIVLVRDPRDVAASLANHSSSTIEAAITFMNNPKTAYCSTPGREFTQVRQWLGSWSRHAASWIDQRDIPIHLIRYEDLLAAPADVFAAALAFCGHPADRAAIEKAVRFTEFGRLQTQERQKGFSEWVDDKTARGRLFFRQGKAGAWTDELTAEQVTRIETEHHGMMRRLGYRPAGVTAASA